MVDNDTIETSQHENSDSVFEDLSNNNVEQIHEVELKTVDGVNQNLKDKWNQNSYNLSINIKHCLQYIDILKNNMDIVLLLMFHAPISNDKGDSFDKDLRQLFDKTNIFDNYTTWIPNPDDKKSKIPIEITSAFTSFRRQHINQITNEEINEQFPPQEGGNEVNISNSNPLEDPTMLAIDFDVYIVYDALTLRWALVDKVTMMNAVLIDDETSEPITTLDYMYDILTQSFYKKHRVIWRLDKDETSVTQDTTRKLELASSLEPFSNKLKKKQWYMAKFKDESKQIESINYFIQQHNSDNISQCAIFPISDRNSGKMQ